jgi:tetratricopeptide (TPR) repeat protein
MTELSLARRWFTRGEEAMQAQRPKVAADDYRTALNYDRDNQQYRLRLAQALLADNHLPEARAHLTSLWEKEPANGEVNLTLARLESRAGNYPQALRYYSDAVNGVWQSDPRKSRTDVRFEVARYLMGQQDRPGAEAELLPLLADAPPDPADQLLLGQMLLEIKEPAHAVQAFDALLTRDNSNVQAWMGKAQALLSLGDYNEAERSSAKAVEYDPNSDNARQQLELTRELLRVNPAMRGLPLAERALRVARAFDTSMTRLRTCADEQRVELAPAGTASNGLSNEESPTPPNDFQLLYTKGVGIQPQANEQALRKDPDALEPTMQYVFHVEQFAANHCATMTSTDRALLTLAQHQGETLR